MNREKAVACLKDILLSSENMSPDVISFDASGAKLPRGYAIHIKGIPVLEDKQIVKNIAAKHCLVVKEEGNNLIIFTAEPQKQLANCPT
jgi:hypothetical protein